ncbi:alpha/beta hydrolase [Ottowia thiooxydans]|uniref:alpha/beta hydrolase n=1 Tax=Ottowia thiooxydans TaxID=219182 RepID=UPI0003FC2571|nr:alpha/beta hydrolase [Ottowia thiooxydans]
MEVSSYRILELVQREELNYSLRPRHPERDSVYADYRTRSEQFRAQAEGWKSISYGESERCAIDWFPPLKPAGADAGAPQAPAPLLIFIHGGFWRALDHRLFSFIAHEYVKRGIAVAMLGYQLAPEVRVTDIFEQVCSAVRLLNAQAAELNFDPHRVCISGHSAGGQLAAMLSGTPPDQLGGHPLVSVVPVSGVFSLPPLLLTTVNHDVRMTPDEALRMSPSVLTRFYGAQFLVAVGGLETEGFIGQSRDFVDTVKGLGIPASLQIVPGRTHFDILEELASPGFELFERVLEQLLSPHLSET